MGIMSWLRGDDLMRHTRDVPVPARRAVAMLPTYQAGKPQWPDPTTPILTRDGYRKCVTAFACLNLIADATAEATLRAYDGDRNEIEDHPLRQLMQRPNPTKGEYEFLSDLIRTAGLSGLAAYQKVRSGAGRPVQLWRFDTAHLRPVLRDMAEPDWEYHLPGNPKRTIRAADVFTFAWMDALSPTDPTGDTPMRVILREAGIATDLTDFIKLTLDRGGAPLMVIVADLPDGAEPLEDAEVDRLRERWRQVNGGVGNWDAPAYLEGARIERLGFDLNEMAFKDLRGQVDSAVCAAFRVPMQVVQTVLGQESSTYSNYREALKVLQLYTCGPLRARLDGAITRDLLPEFDADPSHSVEFDTSRVEALQESQDEKHKRALEALKAGGIQLDTFLEETGRTPIGGDLGQSFYLPFSVIVTPPTGPEPEPEPEPTPPPAGDEDERMRAALRRRFGPNGHHPTALHRLPETRKQAAAASAKGTIARLGDKGAPALRRFFRSQGERVVAAATRSAVGVDGRSGLNGAALYGFAADGVPTGRDVAGIDWDEEERLLRAVLSPLHAAAGDAAYAAAGDLLGVEMAWDLANPNVRRVLDRLAARVVGITQTTRDDVRRVVGDALSEGVSMDELASRLKTLFTGTYRGRALTVARTESMNAYGAASVLGYAESGVVSGAEVWDNPAHTDDYGASDGLTCASRHGIVVDLDRAYSHVEADHPNGSAVLLPVLATPLGEE